MLHRYGPIFIEAFSLEERSGSTANALRVARRGLECIPRHGPLWFALLRVAERIDTETEYASWVAGQAPVLAQIRAEAARGVQGIPKVRVMPGVMRAYANNIT